MHDSIRVVLFDAVGTLIRPVPDVAAVYAAAGWRWGSRHDINAIRSRFGRALAHHDIDHCTSEEVERRRWQQVVAEVFDDVPEAAEALFAELWEHFASPAHWSLYDDVIPTWSWLRDQGVAIGIASNFDARLDGIVGELPPLHLADHLFCSSLIGFSKPHPKFYLHIQRELGIPARRIMMVGDDHRNDVLAPRGIGWQATWIQRQGESSPHTGMTRLTDLADVP